jgi:hypothetical protein
MRRLVPLSGYRWLTMGGPQDTFLGATEAAAPRQDRYPSMDPGRWHVSRPAAQSGAPLLRPVPVAANALPHGQQALLYSLHL